MQLQRFEILTVIDLDPIYHLDNVPSAIGTIGLGTQNLRHHSLSMGFAATMNYLVRGLGEDLVISLTGCCYR